MIAFVTALISAGRESMSQSTQALCFLAGANSIFTGDRLLTTPNAGDDSDAALFAKLGLKPLEAGLAKSRPGYAEYVKRTSGFIPMPPRSQS